MREPRSHDPRHLPDGAKTPILPGKAIASRRPDPCLVDRAKIRIFEVNRSNFLIGVQIKDAHTAIETEQRVDARSAPP